MVGIGSRRFDEIHRFGCKFCRRLDSRSFYRSLQEAEERSAAAVSERDMSISDLRQRIEAMKAHAAEQQAKVHRERVSNRN